MEQLLSLKRRIYRKICYIFCRQLPDKLYLKLMYQVKLGKKCNLNNPQTFNEKLNWLKLYDRCDCYTKMADKYEVRSYIQKMLGEEYLIPLIGVWSKAEDIEFDKLPEQFVLKCTHDSASVIICKDKANFDQKSAIEQLNNSLHTNYYYASREWPYKNIVPRIIAEKYMVDESNTELKDYKIYNFNGIPQLIQVDYGRFTNHQRNLYSTKWEYIDEEIEYPKNADVIINKPENLDEMLRCAQILSKGIPSVRTDFYSINGKTYFGEITFYQEGGFAHFSSDEFEKQLGELILLPEDKKNV